MAVIVQISDLHHADARCKCGQTYTGTARTPEQAQAIADDKCAECFTGNVNWHRFMAGEFSDMQQYANRLLGQIAGVQP